MSGFWCRSGTFGLALVKPEQQAFGSAAGMTAADDKNDITDEPEQRLSVCGPTGDSCLKFDFRINSA
jgi:hypothetical protein